MSELYEALAPFYASLNGDVPYAQMAKYVQKCFSAHFDGEVKFVKIKNKSRRKKIAIYSMEDVTMIAPVMDRSVYGQVNNPKMKVQDLTSQKEDANVYAMVAKGEQGPEVIKFEPDEQFLDAIARKNPMKVKK